MTAPTPGENRLNGWKAIALYFQRDRTTVMRWAKERALPVHRLPGGKIGGVFAIREELDEWRIRYAAEAELEAEPVADIPAETGPEPDPVAVVQPPGRSRRWLLPALGALALVGGAAGWMAANQPPARESGEAASQLPADPALVPIYVEARDLWARRTAASLADSIEKLRLITAQEPRFAAGHAALAEALLLAGEFGSVPYDQAMREARRVTDRALALDPKLATANRADGFIAYWWERDPVRSGRAFRRAIATDPNLAQTHFWYANVLSDNGDHAAGLAEFDKARLLEPGSVPITTDYAWALWSAGRDEEGREILERLAATSETAVVHDSLSHIALAAEDYPAYARHLQAYARMRGDRDSLALAQAVSNALPEGDAAVVRAVLDDGLQDVANGKAPDRVWAAFMASLAGDRELLVSILDAALRREELWGGSGFTSRIADKWSGDAEILERLDRLRAPSMVEP